MSTRKKVRPVTVEEYLEGERYSSTRHEFVDGVARAMVGASVAHNLIAGAIHSGLRTHLRGTACQVLMAEVKLRVGDDFFYPDVFVVCDRADADPYVKTRPVLVVEVLSPATALYDAQEKLIAYRSIESLREYLLVEQERREVRVHRRNGTSWDTAVYAGAAPVRLESVDMSLSLDEIYGDVLP